MEGNLCEECRHTFSTWRPAPGPGSRPSPTGTVTSYVEFKRKRTTLHGTACPMCRTVSAYLGKILVNEHSLERMLSGGSRPGSWSNVIARRLLETAYQFQLMPSLLEYGSVSLTFNYIERSSTDRRRDPVQPPLVALVGPGRPSDHRPNFSILAAHGKHEHRLYRPARGNGADKLVTWLQTLLPRRSFLPVCPSGTQLPTQLLIRSMAGFRTATLTTSASPLERLLVSLLGVS